MADFLGQAAKVPAPVPGAPRGRLIFAMDATASRAPSWAQAMAVQADMFREAAALGGLDVQLAYYRGLMEFDAQPFTANADRMVSAMQRVSFLAGETQIERVLRHAAAETRRQKVNAVVFIGDAMEESADRLVGLAGQLGVLAVPVFVFHEGGGEPAASTFRAIAKASGGAYAAFDAASPQRLRDLLRGVAAFAAGGRKALSELGRRNGGAILQLTHDVGGG
ncbi:MAG: VWA domain-containing protein [Rhodospirillaceae bacterium]|nr:VWA domain-containing protein [Rhodospirillaceae bacterium]